jgi:hypothetical protein
MRELPPEYREFLFEASYCAIKSLEILPPVKSNGLAVGGLKNSSGYFYCLKLLSLPIIPEISSLGKNLGASGSTNYYYKTSKSSSTELSCFS